MACAAIISACGSSGGGDGGGTCAYVGGTTYTGTEALNGCGLNTQKTVTYEFYQSTKSCDVTINTPLESCPGTLDGNTLTWTCPPISGITYQQATATFSSDLATLNGSFKWTTTGCTSPATTTLTSLTKN